LQPNPTTSFDAFETALDTDNYGTRTKALNANNLLRGLILLLTLSFAGLIYYSLRDTSAKEGQAAPVFTLKTDQGRGITPDSFGGKVLVLNFWATWCPPCIQEVPSLNEFQQRFANQGVVVVAVSIDKNADKYRSFLSKIPVAFQTARDPNADVSSEYGTYQIPETYIIKNGVVMRKFPEAENWMSDDLTQYVQSLL
jgi:cytochrome c biogenesis protein CcmG/thiol:disulfide interchange protein DsbE